MDEKIFAKAVKDYTDRIAVLSAENNMLKEALKINERAMEQERKRPTPDQRLKDLELDRAVFDIDATLARMIALRKDLNKFLEGVKK